MGARALSGQWVQWVDWPHSIHMVHVWGDKKKSKSKGWMWTACPVSPHSVRVHLSRIMDMVRGAPRSLCVLTDSIQGLTCKVLNYHGLWAGTRDPAISWGRRTFRGRAAKETPKEVRWAEKEHQGRKDQYQYPGLVWSIEKVKKLSPLSGRARHCKASKSCLLLRTSNKIIYCPLPSQSQQNYKVKKKILKAPWSLDTITSV